MNTATINNTLEPHVPETAFGKWFLQTETWSIEVLEVAMKDLERLIPDRRRVLKNRQNWTRHPFRRCFFANKKSLEKNRRIFMLSKVSCKPNSVCL